MCNIADYFRNMALQTTKKHRLFNRVNHIYVDDGLIITQGKVLNLFAQAHGKRKLKREEKGHQYMFKHL